VREIAHLTRPKPVSLYLLPPSVALARNGHETSQDIAVSARHVQSEKGHNQVSQENNGHACNLQAPISSQYAEASPKRHVPCHFLAYMYSTDESINGRPLRLI